MCFLVTPKPQEMAAEREGPHVTPNHSPNNNPNLTEAEERKLIARNGGRKGRENTGSHEERKAEKEIIVPSRSATPDPEPPPSPSPSPSDAISARGRKFTSLDESL